MEVNAINSIGSRFKEESRGDEKFDKENKTNDWIKRNSFSDWFVSSYSTSGIIKMTFSAKFHAIESKVFPLLKLPRNFPPLKARAELNAWKCVSSSIRLS